MSNDTVLLEYASTNTHPAMRRREILLIALLSACLVAAACWGGWQWFFRVKVQNYVVGGLYIPTQPTRTVDDPASAYAGSVDLLNAPDFHFTMGDGSGWHGYDVVKVAADGSAEYTFLDPVPIIGPDGVRRQQWRHVEFTIDVPTMQGLRALLNDIGYFHLKKEYHADIQDGTQQWLKVEASRRKKGVYCNNYFPPEVQRVRGFVQQRIFDPHAAEIGAAKPIDITLIKPEKEAFD
jgi:hypothetical protein